jgi:hypothetical protein
VSGLLAVAVLWTGIGGAVLGTGFAVTGDRPLSRLAGEDGAGAVFGPVLVLTGLLFVAFASDVVHRYPGARPFGPVLVTAMVGQIVTGVVPIGPDGRSAPVHVAAGLVLGGLLPVALAVFALGQPAGPWRAVACGLAGLQVAATVTGLVLSARGVAAIAEIVPALTFHTWVVAVTVHDPGGPGRPAATGRSGRSRSRWP